MTGSQGSVLETAGSGSIEGCIPVGGAWGEDGWCGETNNVERKCVEKEPVEKFGMVVGTEEERNEEDTGRREEKPVCIQVFMVLDSWCRCYYIQSSSGHCSKRMSYRYSTKRNSWWNSRGRVSKGYRPKVFGWRKSSGCNRRCNYLDQRWTWSLERVALVEKSSSLCPSRLSERRWTTLRDDNSTWCWSPWPVQQVFLAKVERETSLLTNL